MCKKCNHDTIPQLYRRTDRQRIPSSCMLELQALQGPTVTQFLEEHLAANIVFTLSSSPTSWCWSIISHQSSLKISQNPKSNKEIPIIHVLCIISLPVGCQFLLCNIRVYFEFVSLFYSCIVIVVVLEPIMLLIALFSRLGYKFNKHLLTYRLGLGSVRLPSCV